MNQDLFGSFEDYLDLVVSGNSLYDALSKGGMIHQIPFGKTS